MSLQTPAKIAAAIDEFFRISTETSHKAVPDAIKALADALEQVGDPRASVVRPLRLDRLSGQYVLRHGAGEADRTWPYAVNDRRDRRRQHRRALDGLRTHLRDLLCLHCPLCAHPRMVNAPFDFCPLSHYVYWIFRPLNYPWPEVVVRLAEAIRGGDDCDFALHDALLESGHPELASCISGGAAAEEMEAREYLLDLILGRRSEHVRLPGGRRLGLAAPGSPKMDASAPSSAARSP